MRGERSAVVWLAAAVGAGTLLGSVPSVLATVPAGTMLLLAARAGGLRGIGGVSAAIVAGWAGASAAPGSGAACLSPPTATDDAAAAPLVVLGYPTEASQGARGAMAFRAIQIRGRTCRRTISLYGHGGHLVAGTHVELLGRFAPMRGRTPVFVVDSISLRDPGQRLGGFASQLGAGLVRTRIGFEHHVEGSLHPRSVPLAVALTSGRRDAVPVSVRDDFARSGTAHLLAVSGFHVGVIGGLFALTAALAGANPRRRVVISVVLIWIYVVMIGTPASGVRAAGLLTAVCVGRLLGRPTRRLPALAAVFLVCLGVRPDWLSGIGFQLSFAASVGLVLTARWPDRASAWVARKCAGAGQRMMWVAAVLEPTVRGATVAVGATLPTVPFVAWHFGAVSVVSVPATLMAMPLAAASIVAVLTTAAVGFVLPGAGHFLGAGSSELLILLERVVEAWASLSFATVAVDGPTSIALGAALLVVPMLIPRAARGLPLAMGAVFGVLASLLIVEGWKGAEAQGTVELIFIDVGQGDALLIRSPADRWVLIDAGPASASWNAGERRVVPALLRNGATHLESLILTHADSDHVGGAAAVLRSVSVASVMDPARARATQLFQAALSVASDRGVVWRKGVQGLEWSMDGIEFTVLSPEPHAPPSTANDDSLVILLRFGEFEALLTGDAGAEVERRILPDLPESLEVLKAGHHGSATSTAAELLEHTSPEAAVISVGRRNRYGHPDSGVLARIRRQGARILRTDLHGTIRITASRSGRFAVDRSR